jgi:putative ABC transport system permease protein
MKDILVCAVRELRRRWLRSLAATMGYLLAGAFIVVIVLMMRLDIQAEVATVNYMGARFLAYDPFPRSGNVDDIGRPLNPADEGFFAEPTVTTRLLPKKLIEQIAAIPEVRAVAPFLLFRFKQGANGHIFSLGAFDPTYQDAVRSTLVSPKDIVSGAFFREGDSNVVIVDKSYADLWELKVGSVVIIGDMLYPVIGITSSHARTARADVYMNWRDAEAAINKRLGRPIADEVNLFLIEANGAENTPIAIKKVEEVMKQGHVNPVVCMPPVVKFIGLSHDTLKLALAIVALLIALLAMNSQWAAVSERRHEIAILKAVGWKDSRIFLQIVAESVLVALIGSLLGIIVGYLGFIIVSASMVGKANVAYQVLRVPLTIAGIMLAALLTGVISGLMPAITSVKTRPAEVLRTL